MPAPERPAGLTGRRVLLRAGLAGAAALSVLGVSGCRLRIGSPSHDATSTPPQRTTDQQALDRAAARADQLAGLYAAGARVRLDLAPVLRQLAADHTAHTAALLALGATAATVSGAGSSTSPASNPSSASSPSAPTSSTSGPPSGSPSSPDVTATTALSVLGQAERSAVEGTLADLEPTGPQAARLLASLAACSSAHLTLLARLPATARTVATPTGAAS